MSSWVYFFMPFIVDYIYCLLFSNNPIYLLGPNILPRVTNKYHYKDQYS